MNEFKLKDFDVVTIDEIVHDVHNFIEHWGKGLSKKSYEKVENTIYKNVKKWSFARVYFWCDISGYEYWVKEREDDNYIICTVELLKPLTERRLNILNDYILKSQEYFENLIYKLEKADFEYE